MRYFKFLKEDGDLAAFGKNDTIGAEITEEEYNSLLERYPRPDYAETANTAYEKAQAWDVLMGVSE